MSKLKRLASILVCAVLLFGSKMVHAQKIVRDSINFHYSLSDPELPPELSKTLYDQLGGTKQVKLSKVEFGSRLTINTMFNDGNIITGGPLHELVNGVGELILESNDLDREEIRFFVTTDDYANAYCFSTGDIFISVPLLARLKNLEQLAFILSHELVHFMKQHSVQRYEKYIEMRNTSEKDVEDYFSFSRDNEFEADLIAVELFAKANFDTTGVVDIFNLLELSFLPNADYVFGPNDVNCSYFELNPNVLNSDYPELIFDEKEVSLYSTHPDARSRKKRVQEALTKAKLSDGHLTHKDESKWREQLKLSRFYEVQVANQNKEYLDAIYINYGLRKEFVINDYLAEQEAISLANLQLLYKTNEYSRYARLPRFVKGQAHVFYAFFDQLKGKELGTLVTGRLYTLDDMFPKNQVIQECLSRVLSSDNLAIQLPMNKKVEVVKDSIKEIDTASNNATLKDYTFSEAYEYWLKNEVGEIKVKSGSSGSGLIPYFTRIDLPKRTILKKNTAKIGRILVVEPTSSKAVKKPLRQSHLRSIAQLEKRIEKSIATTIKKSPYDEVTLNGQAMASNKFDASDWIHIKQLEKTISGSNVYLIPGNMRDIFERFASYEQIMFINCEQSFMITNQPALFWSSFLFPPMLAVSLNDLFKTEIEVTFYANKEHMSLSYDIQGLSKIKMMNALYNSFLELNKSNDK
ncbi:MAG: M48 family metallopeptidase [Fluviicola sp.]